MTLHVPIRNTRLNEGNSSSFPVAEFVFEVAKDEKHDEGQEQQHISDIHCLMIPQNKLRQHCQERDSLIFSLPETNMFRVSHYAILSRDSAKALKVNLRNYIHN